MKCKICKQLRFRKGRKHSDGSCCPLIDAKAAPVARCSTPFAQKHFEEIFFLPVPKSTKYVFPRMSRHIQPETCTSSHEPLVNDKCLMYVLCFASTASNFNMESSQKDKTS